MTQDSKAPITERWWFKLLRVCTVGIFQGIGLLFKGFLGLSTKAKLGIGGSLAAVFILVGVLGYQENQKARELGFASVQEMRAAEKVKCADKSCYDRYLLAQRQAEEATLAEAEAKNAAGKGKTLGQWLDETKAEGNSSNTSVQQEATGQQSSGAYAVNNPDDPRFWIKACKVWASARMQCTGNSNYDSCISSRMASTFGYENKDIGLGAGQFCNEDGSTFIKVN